MRRFTKFLRDGVPLMTVIVVSRWCDVNKVKTVI